MIDFQILVLSSLTLLTVAMFIFYRLVITNQLHRRKQIRALQDYVKALETQKGRELTEKQADALIRLAKGLINCIEADK